MSFVVYFWGAFCGAVAYAAYELCSEWYAGRKEKRKKPGWYAGRKEKRKKLEVLLYELKQNKRHAEKEGRSGYQVSAYEDGYSYLLDMPDDLKQEIGMAYAIISAFRHNPNDVNFNTKIPELKGLLEDTIPKFEKWLNQNI